MLARRHRRVRADREQAGQGDRPDARLVAAVDANLARAEQLAKAHPGCVGVGRLAGGRRRGADVDVVVVATTNDQLAPVTLAAVKAGKHVLVEKPAARNAAELEPVAAAARRGVRRARRRRQGRLQPPLPPRPAQGPRDRRRRRPRPAHVPPRPLRPRRPARAWRPSGAATRPIAGGGEMLDQGVHLVDLARWFLGDFPHVTGHVGTLLLGLEGRGQRLRRPPHRRRTRWRSSTPAAPSGRTCSRWRSTAATASSRSTASAAATASSGSRSTRCSRKWARRRRRSGSSRARTGRGTPSGPTSPRASRSGSSRWANLDDALATLVVIRRAVPAVGDGSLSRSHVALRCAPTGRSQP